MTITHHEWMVSALMVHINTLEVLFRTENSQSLQMHIVNKNTHRVFNAARILLPMGRHSFISLTFPVT